MASTKLLVFLAWISYGLCALVYAVLTTEYNRVIIFKGPMADKRLPGHVIRTETVVNEGGCRVKCFLEPNCVSINVGPAVGGKRSCELNNDTDESPEQSALKGESDYIHYAVENVCKINGEPCPGENNLCQVGFTDKRYRCVCRDGYKHREHSTDQCEDIDECKEDLYDCQEANTETKSCPAQRPHRCPQNSECANEPGSFRCDCKNGFVKDGAACIDIDECQSNELQWCTHKSNLECINTPGSFRCECIPGFARHGKPWRCKECQDALGMENHTISDARISASSERTVSYRAFQGRLHLKNDGDIRGSWASARDDKDQWLQVDLGNPNTTVTGVATQGRDNYDWWVIKYKLQYSKLSTSMELHEYKEEDEDQSKEFDGNRDSDTVVRHNLTKPITASIIRFQPTEWHTHISMRVELYGCFTDQMHEQECRQDTYPLGMENGNISDERITSSSERIITYRAYQGRLHSKKGGAGKDSWVGGRKDTSPWLQVDLGSQFTRVTGVATQGGNKRDWWVSEYKLLHSLDNEETSYFQFYVEEGQNVKIFDGNSDRETVVRHNLTKVITARYIRFQPTVWHVLASMRVELYGCFENWKKINTGPVCFGARDNSYGAFNIRESGVIYTFKLVHLSGSIRCNTKYPPSYWGCDNPWYGDTRLLTVLTFKNRSALLLADYTKRCGYPYKIEGVGVNETELRFNNLPSPISVFVGNEFQIWYGQDLKNCSESGNSGQTCADVYAWYA